MTTLLENCAKCLFSARYYSFPFGGVARSHACAARERRSESRGSLCSPLEMESSLAGGNRYHHKEPKSLMAAKRAFSPICPAVIQIFAPKESVFIAKEFNSHKTGHQHGHQPFHYFGTQHSGRDTSCLVKRLCKLQTRANRCNIVGCYLLRPFAHPVACCCAKFETG